MVPGSDIDRRSRHSETDYVELHDHQKNTFILGSTSIKSFDRYHQVTASSKDVL